MLDLRFTNQFKKDYKLAQKRGYDLSEFQEIVDKLRNREPLDPKYKDHPLKLILPRQGNSQVSGTKRCNRGGGEPLMQVNLHTGNNLVFFVLKDKARMNGHIPGIPPVIIIEEFGKIF